MIKCQISDEFETSIDAYWAMFFSDEFNAALWPHIKVVQKMLEFERQGEGEQLEIRRRHHLTPDREVPAMLKRFVKGAIGYEEHNHFQRSKSQMTVKIIPGLMADRFECEGVFSVHEAGPNKVIRSYDATIKCSVPMVGGAVEKTINDSVKDSYEKATAFTRNWIRDHA